MTYDNTQIIHTIHNDNDSIVLTNIYINFDIQNPCVIKHLMSVVGNTYNAFFNLHAKPKNFGNCI